MGLNKKAIVFIIDVLIGILVLISIISIAGFFYSEKKTSHIEKIDKWRSLHDALIISAGKLIDNFDDLARVNEEFSKMTNYKFKIAIEKFNPNFEIAGSIVTGDEPDYNEVISEKYLYLKNDSYYMIMVQLW